MLPVDSPVYNQHKMPKYMPHESLPLQSTDLQVQLGSSDIKYLNAVTQKEEL